MLTTLEEQMVEKEGIFHGLQEKTAMLCGKEQSIDQEIIDQQAQCKQLKEQVARWKMLTDQERAHSAQEQKERIIKLERALLQRSERVAQERRKLKIVPQAVARARQELIKKYSNQDVGAQFIEQLLQQINSRAS